ncbi:hypothetical protein PIB30_024549 [Stylosanthes scabra]|uniref:Secreted protein n=1 Tax=Stylosanthes scabra TaxID=79078 RepID=A0ABU6SAA1_9FABA|nr:hypothetical protein [Stylosanthes scabra]
MMMFGSFLCTIFISHIAWRREGAGIHFKLFNTSIEESLALQGSFSLSLLQRRGVAAHGAGPPIGGVADSGMEAASSIQGARNPRHRFQNDLRIRGMESQRWRPPWMSCIFELGGAELFY